MPDTIRRLVEFGLDIDLAAALDSALCVSAGEIDYLQGDGCSGPITPSDTASVDGSLMSPLGRLVIRDEDLKIVASIGSGIMAAAGAGFFVDAHTAHAQIIAAVCGITLAGWQAANQFRKKVKSVEPHQYKILGCCP